MRSNHHIIAIIQMVLPNALKELEKRFHQP